MRLSISLDSFRARLFAALALIPAAGCGSAVDDGGQPSGFSMSGPWLGIAAPGENILSLSNAAGGGLVYIPSGRYLITGALTASAGTANATNRIALAVGSNTHILASDSATIQLKAFANCYLIGNKDWTNGNQNITVEGGVWDGNGGINVVDGVVHYCVSNMPGAVARTATYALNAATLPVILALANRGWREALKDDVGLRAGLNICNGQVTHPKVAEALGKKYMPAITQLSEI